MKKYKGFSIISLMVASAIGIFLVSGIMRIYVDTKNSFNFRTAVASATENARFAIQDMQRNLVMAGRGIYTGHDTPLSYKVQDNNKRTFPGLSPDGTSVSGSTGIVDIDDNDSSIIAIRFAEGPAPCGGSGRILNTTTTVRFYINNNNELVCDAGIALPIVSGIIKMRALYGVDINNDGMANVFITAKAVENHSKWSSVVSIRVGLISTSDQTIPGTYKTGAIENSNLLGYEYSLPDRDHFFKS